MSAPHCARARVRVRVRDRGRQYIAALPTRWQAGESTRARRLLERAQAAMRKLRSVRQLERVTSGPGSFAQTTYRLQAPDRFAYINAPSGTASVVIGKRQWSRYEPGAPWQPGRYGSGIAFSTRSWWRWTNYAQEVRLLRQLRRAGRRLAVVALMGPGTPAWIRLTIDIDRRRVVEEMTIAKGNFATSRYSAFNAPVQIVAPNDSR